MAYEEVLEANVDRVFELVDPERNITYEVQEIPIPQRAEQLLQEHGLPSQEC